jgi:S1-C subfamily serine protease
MATGLVIHISSGEDRHTEILTDDSIRIGTAEGCSLRLRSSNLPKEAGNAVLLEMARSNGAYRVTAFDPALPVTLNGEELSPGTEIQDGDELRVGDSELVLHFYPVRALPAVVPRGAPGSKETHVAPFIEAAAIESAATARRDDAKVFLREFTRELVREIKPSTKLITLAIAIALVGGVLYLGFAMFKEMQRSRRLIDDQRAQLTQMRDQVSKTNTQIGDLGRSTKELQASLSLAVKLRSEYGRGVCLIAGSFYFVETGTGRPLRWAEAQINESGSAVQSGNAPESLTPEGNGTVAEYEFVGSGFYVGQGFVITNRHIAQPWMADDRAQSITGGLKAQPRLKKLIAYFPDFAQAIPLKFKNASQRDDLAVCKLEIPEVPSALPVLPLESDPDAVAVGKTVVMMGYPSGPDRLLALLDDAESRGIQQRYGTPMAQLSYLAETKRIQPLTTQGSITDLDVRRIVYDARTAEGGSGAPLFGPSGRVIGVNFAVFTENQASNFAVPIRFAVDLLERTGWTAPSKDGKEAETTAQPSSFTP